MNVDVLADAVARIEDLGGKITYGDDALGGGVVRISLRRSKVGDEDFRLVALFTTLQVLELDETEVTDAGISHLSALTGMESLNLVKTQITDEALRYLSRMKQLKKLDITLTAISGAGLRYLQDLQKLWWLEAGETRTTDDGLEYIARLRAIEFLTLSDTPITNAGLRHLAGMPRLMNLDLSCTRISDAGLVHLRNIPALTSLYLWCTWVTPEGAGNFGSVSVDLPSPENLRFRTADLRHRSHKIEGYPVESSDAPWARVSLEVNHDTARWYPYRPDTPAPAEELTEMPTLGELYRLNVPKKLECSRVLPIWVLFQPYPASEDGWGAHPELLAGSAIVQCLALESAPATADEYAVVLEVLDVVPLRDFHKRFEPQTSSPGNRIVSGADPSTSKTKTYWSDDLFFVYMNMESDVVIWAVYQRTATHDLLLLYAESFFGKEFTVAGHRPLSAEESRALLPAKRS